jgi:hypothetical protein
MTTIINKSILGKASLSIAIAVALVACTPSKTDKNDVSGKADTVKAVSKERTSKAKKVFSSIPEPVETTKLLKDAGAKYDAKYLNPIENAAKYTSVKAKAINLGIYGSDLSFISLFDQTQESMLYLKCTNTLASGLGITGAFDENTTTRIQNNLDKKDSLLSIISQSYWTADNYLVENGQPGTSSLIVAGGWIEGLYIATKVAAATKNETIVNQIGQQKTSLTNLMELLDNSKAENAGIAEVMKTLTDLKKIYDGITETKLTDDQLKQISDKAAEIRSGMIKI